MNTPFDKVYLGDGVFVAYQQSGDIMLITSDGIITTNVIFMEPEVISNFEDYLTDLKIKLTEAKEERERQESGS